MDKRYFTHVPLQAQIPDNTIKDFDPIRCPDCGLRVSSDSFCPECSIPWDGPSVAADALAERGEFGGEL